jgi:hypothetical protein
MISARLEAASSESIMSFSVSAMVVIHLTGKLISVNFWAIQWALVLRVQPARISLPIDIISTFTCFNFRPIKMLFIILVWHDA